jgi:phospholipase/carboxylesterase
LSEEQTNEELWIELPPGNSATPQRLMIFIHSAATSTEQFLPVVIHWQMKFPSATAIALHDPLDPLTGRRGWVSDPRFSDLAEIESACKELERLIRSAQQATGLDAEKTLVIGHGIGASIALQTLRFSSQPLAQAYVGFGARLISPARSTETFTMPCHLVQGDADTLNPIEHARRTHKALLSLHCPSTLDIIEGATHWIDQDMINMGTTRLMQTLFKGRQRPTPRQHDILIEPKTLH